MSQKTGPQSVMNIPLDREVKEAAGKKHTRFTIIYSFISVWLGTTFFAFWTGWDRSLDGEKLAPFIYNPIAIFWPWSHLLFVKWKNPSFGAHIHLGFYISFGIMIAGTILGWIYAHKHKEAHIAAAPRAHDYEGSAHWATPQDVGDTGFLPPDHWASIEAFQKQKSEDAKLGIKTNPLPSPEKWAKTPGIFVGEYTDPKTKKRTWLRDTSDRHVALFAPTRGGKGVGIIIPACLTWSHSLVVNDPKSEIHALTSHYRKYKMGQRIFKFDPLSVDGSSARINVLDFVRLRTDYEESDATNIAKMICDPQGLGLDTGSDSDHWRKTAVALLTGVILHVLYCRDIPAEKKNLPGVDAFLSNPKKSLNKIFSEVLTYDHDPDYERGWTDLEGNLTKTCQTAAMAAQDMISRPESERGSVMSSAKSYLAIYRDRIVSRNIETSDFSFEDLMYGDRPATLYLVSTPNTMETVRPLMRLIVNVIMTTFTGGLEFEKDSIKDLGRPKDKHKFKLLMLMDEFTSTMSKMSIFANAISFVAGYGIKILIVVQDLIQLADTYGESGAQNITANMHTQIYYATNNPKTAEQISSMLGSQTLRMETRSWNGGKPSRSESFRGRKLLDPSEIQALPKTDEIVMVTNHPPIYAKKLVYHREPAFMQRIGRALEKSDIIPKEEQLFYVQMQPLIEEAKRKAAIIIAAATAEEASKVGATSAAVKSAKGLVDTIELMDDGEFGNLNDLKGIV